MMRRSPCELAVRDRLGVGPFILGSNVNSVLPICRGLEQYVSVLASPDDKDKDIVVLLQSFGLRLSFEGRSQQLSLIAVSNGSPSQDCDSHLYRTVSYTYKGHSLVSIGLKQVLQILGSAFECYIRHGEDQEWFYYLCYPGLIFRFPITAEVQRLIFDKKTQPVDVITQSADAILVFEKPPEELADATPYTTEGVQPPPRATIQIQSRMNNPIKVIIGKGIEIGNGSFLAIESSLQNALVELGPPDAINIKTVDAGSLLLGQNKEKRSYFYNYFKQGLDLLICGQTHRILKIILHNNLPRHCLFGIYNRSFFQLLDEKGTYICDSDTKWSSIDQKESLLGQETPPLLVREMGNDVIRVFCGYPGVVFELFERMDMIASITVF